MKTIPFNVWDDYCDDPQAETYGYVENSMSDEQKKPIIKIIFNYIKSLNMPDVESTKDGIFINFKNLTHEKREKLIEKLETSDIKYNGIPINFYSES